LDDDWRGFSRIFQTVSRKHWAGLWLAIHSASGNYTTNKLAEPFMTVSTLNLAQTTLADVWPEFTTRLATTHARLQQELESCWRDMESIIADQQRQTQSVETMTAAELPELRTARAEAARVLFSEPLAQWERRRPYQRALLAFESYDHALVELARTLPSTLIVTGAQLRETLAPWEPTTFARRLTWLQRGELAVPLAQLVNEALPQLAWMRVDLEGRYLLALAQAVQQLRRNWEAARAALDAASTSASAAALAANARGAEAKRWAAIQREAATALTAWGGWPARLHSQVANRLLQQLVRRKAGDTGKDAARRARYVAHWEEQGQALAAELRFEAMLERSEDRLLGEAHESLESLRDEARRLSVERDGFITWLRARQNAATQNLSPQPQANVVPAASRLAEFQQTLQATLSTLPTQVIIQARCSAAPSRWARARVLHPRETLAEAFSNAGRAPLAKLWQGIETSHQQIVREIEHAREVVSFGLGETTTQRDAQIASEALQNALALLEFQRDEARDWRPAAQARAALTLAQVFNENRLVLSRNRVGAFAHLWQQGLRRGGQQAWRGLMAGLRKGARNLWSALKVAGEAALRAIGWLPAPSVQAGEVVRRPLLPAEFTADLSAKELPAIYRRLFRVEAVQDPRFLIGREAEMAALAEARDLWEAKRPVSVLLVGERGSGKTSLINCALARPLAGLAVTRGECRARLHTAEALREFLAALLAVPVAELETALAAERRVIILEELERAFLRQIGHYEAMRELQRLIAASCQTTLWIVVTNQIAFRLLNAAVGLGQSFSHRLNAASVNPVALREAILLRHNLSGLRLQFGAAQAANGWWQRLKRRLRGQPDPQQEFFDKLARESAGVFRAAFEIWLGQIEFVRGGALLMKPLVTPDLSPVIDDLDLEDLFTLVAVMQHGSLTADEFSVIFQKSPAASRAQLDELLAREIIEPDPGRDGLRVRPEAMRVVQEALYRRNLL
jgi:hypothetical protein